MCGERELDVAASWAREQIKLDALGSRRYTNVHYTAHYTRHRSNPESESESCNLLQRRFGDSNDSDPGKRFWTPETSLQIVSNRGLKTPRIGSLTSPIVLLVDK
jgi:hypothetical protein